MTARLVIALAALATACSGGSQANLSVSARSAAGTSITAGSAATATSLDLGNGITLDRVRIVIRKLKLEGPSSSGAQQLADLSAVSKHQDSVSSSSGSGSGDSGSSGSSGSSGRSGSNESGSSGSVTIRDGSADGKTDVEHESDDADEPVVGPLFADLAAGSLSSGLQQLFQGAVPAGTFRELKIAIGPVSASHVGTNAGLAAMADRQASLVVDGAIDGKPFSFVTGLVAQLEIEGEIVITAGAANNITISVDPTHWFGGTGAARLDPTDLANRSAIEDAIKRSIRGFEDDDRSGEDDHGGSSGSGHDGAGHT